MLAFGPPAWGSCKGSPALPLLQQLLEEVAWLQLLLLSGKFNFTSTAEVQMSSGAKCSSENLASPFGEAVVDRVTFLAKQNIGDVCSSEICSSLLTVCQGTSAVILWCAPGLLGEHHNLLLFFPSVSSVVTIGQTGVSAHSISMVSICQMLNHL